METLETLRERKKVLLNQIRMLKDMRPGGLPPF